MKGQSVNINWLIGTTVFLTALIFSLTYTFNNYSQKQSGVGLQEQINNIRGEIEEYSDVTVRKTPLIVSEPELDYRIPVKERYIFSDSTVDATLDQLNEINTSNGIVRSTVDTSLEELELTQFYSSVNTDSYSSDVSGGGSLSNSYIDVDPGGNGLQQISFDSTDLLENGASFASSDSSINTYEIYGDTLGGDVEIYDQSPEIVIDTPQTNNYLFKNFTTLYWRNGSNTDTLTGTGLFRSGKTNGLVLHGLNGLNLGAAFVGDLNPEVNKPDNDTVNVSIDASNYRIYLFNDTIQEGKDRIIYEENGGTFFGAAKEFEALSISRLRTINNLDESEVREEFGIENIGYNITISEDDGILVASSTDSTLEWNLGSFLSTTSHGTGSLRLGYNNGNSGDSLVGFYRMDLDSDDVSGSENVRDYSGNDNHGTFSGTEGDERSADGTFSTDSFSFDGSDDSFIADDSASLTIDREIAVSAWFKPEEDHFGGIIQKTDGAEAEYELNHLNNREVGFGLNWNQPDETFCFSGTGVTNIGEWNHALAIYDPNIFTDDIKLYVNGQLESTCSYSEDIDEIPGTADLHVGSNPGGTDEYFNGSIDEVRIFNSAPTNNEIDELLMHENSGVYYGNYTSQTIDFGEKVDWGSLSYDASIPSGTNLKARFEAVNPGGQTVKSKTFTLSDGQNTVDLTDVQSMFQARVTVFGNSDNASKSWNLDSFSINFDDNPLLVSTGSNVPFRDVTITRRSHAGIDEDGEINRLEDRIAVWR